MLHSKVTLCLALLAIVSTVKVLATRPVVKPAEYECRDTQIDLDGNSTLAESLVRKYIVDYITQLDHHNDLSEKARALFDEVLSRNDTDSISTLNSFRSFLTSHALFEALTEYDVYGLCPIAQAINGSVEWADCKDGRLILASLRNTQKNVLKWCTAVVGQSLKLGGCKRLPPVNLASNSNCYKKGTVYELDKALHYFGKNLPCAVTELLYELYYSPKESDNLAAALYVVSISDVSREVVPSYSLARTLEIQYALLDPHDKSCCCKHRRERFLQVCEELNQSDLSEVIEKYQNTECPPGAAYLK